MASLAPPSPAASHDDGRCFHCGEPLAGSGRSSASPAFTVTIDAVARPVCCIGCRAAAELIRDAGLGDYYRFRTASGPRPAADADDVWSTYDRPEVQAPLVAVDDGVATVNLLLEGVRCAACAWLIDQRLARVDGVRRASVNPATARVQVEFEPARVGLAAVLRAIAELGYRPHVLGAADTLAIATRERRSALKRLAVAGFGMMQVMMIAGSLYIGATDGMDPVIREYLRIISLVMSVPVAFYSGWPFLVGAVRGLRTGHVGMDVPVAAAIVGAFAMSTWNTFTGRGDVYFDSVTMFIFLLLLGRYLEMIARHRAGSTTEALLRLVPATAMLVRPDGRERVPVAQLAAGDRVLVASGECFPADGRVVVGETAADESLLTGESRPVPKPVGSLAIAGSLNAGQPVELEIGAVGQSTVLAGIVRLLERAQTERPRIARLADRAATWFVTRVLVGAAVVCAVWLYVDPSRAFEATLAVLVATCPCALSLATPTAITAATAALARRGLLVTHADSLETLARATDVVFDKTGTLTLGRPQLERVAVLDGASTPERCLALAAALERASEHPLAHAFDGIEAAPAAEARVTAGGGVAGTIDGRRYRIGTAAFVGALAGPAPSGQLDTAVFLGTEGAWLGAFTFGDAPRPQAAATVAALRALGLEAHVASGDHADAVESTARHLGIGDWRARLLPEQKLAWVRELRESGRRVLAVGDGINDAPTLRAADVSVAMGTGSSLAQASADLVALHGDLATLPEAVRTARRATAIVRQNLAWSTAYNLVALPLAAFGLIPPWLAAAGMSASSLLVVLNALRLARTPGAVATGTVTPARTASAAEAA
jgi:Cu2+-exporting ATPase